MGWETGAALEFAKTLRRKPTRMRGSIGFSTRGQEDQVSGITPQADYLTFEWLMEGFDTPLTRARFVNAECRRDPKCAFSCFFCSCVSEVLHGTEPLMHISGIDQKALSEFFLFRSVVMQATLATPPPLSIHDACYPQARASPFS